MIILEMLLSLTPSVEHLQLMRCVDLNAFTAHLLNWEKFVQSKLPLLKKFELLLMSDPFQFAANSLDVESIISPFRKAFWIEKNKWFVICDYVSFTRTFILSTLSYFDPELEYLHQIRRNPLVMDRVKKLHLQLETTMSLVTSPQV